jgi:hypothetical protein
MKMHFEDEDGKKFMEAYIDGYHFGETLLEGVIFRAFIKGNKLKVELAKKEDIGYFNTLNTKMWLKAALECANEEDDIFAETLEDAEDGKISLILVKKK